MPVDYRQAAQERITQLAELLQSSGDPAVTPIVAECEALARAIGAFHMEGIRFRMYNVDRLLRAPASASEGSKWLPPAGAIPILEEARKHLEAAGFHTRSHQSPV